MQKSACDANVTIEYSCTSICQFKNLPRQYSKDLDIVSSHRSLFICTFFTVHSISRVISGFYFPGKYGQAVVNMFIKLGVLWGGYNLSSCAAVRFSRRTTPPSRRKIQEVSFFFTANFLVTHEGICENSGNERNLLGSCFSGSDKYPILIILMTSASFSHFIIFWFVRVEFIKWNFGIQMYGYFTASFLCMEASDSEVCNSGASRMQ